MSAIFVCLDWFWCLVCFGALEAYALGTWMRHCEDLDYARQQESRSRIAAFRRR